MKLQTSINLCDIARMQIYVNTGRKTLRKIIDETGADAAINGTLFTGSFAPCPHLKVDGKVLAAERETYWGFGWNNPADLAMVSDYRKHANYLACFALMQNGTMEPMNYAKNGELAGSRGRSAIKMCNGKLTLFASADGLDAKTPEALRDMLAEPGASILMLDGGGSVNAYLGGQFLTTTRIVHNYVLIYLKKESKRMKIALDAGHGEETAGKRSPDGSLREYEFNRDVTARLKGHLERHGIEVLLTVPHNRDTNRMERCAIANKAKVDYFVSVHANAEGDKWGEATGWEIYILSKGGNAEQLAKAIHKRSVPALGLKDRGVKCEAFDVLKYTDMPAVLIEHGFYSNRKECERLKTADFREACAVVDAKGILDYLGIAWVEPVTPTPPAVDKPSDWAAEAWAWAKDSGITDGTNPQGVLTREQAVVMLHRLYDKMK